MVFHRQQQGSALIGALVAMLILGLFGSAYVALTTSELSLTANYRDGAAAQYLAEAGALYACVKLKTDKSFRALTNSATPTVLPAVAKNTGATSGTYEVSVTRFDNNSLKREIVSTGTVRSSKRIVRVVLKVIPFPGFYPPDLAPIAQYGLFSNSGMTINNGVTITGNVRSNATITVGNNVQITGSVQAGGQPALAFPVIISDLYRQKADTVIDTNLTISGTFPLNGGMYYINGDLTVENDSVLSGTAVFYVTGQVIFKNNISAGQILVIAEQDITVGRGTQLTATVLVAYRNLSVGQETVLNGGAFAGGTLTMNQNAVLAYNSNIRSGVETYRNY